MDAFLNEIPAVQAERMLMMARAMALGSGAMKPEDARREWGDLVRLVTGAEQHRSSPQEVAAFAAGVTRRKPRKAANDGR